LQNGKAKILFERHKMYSYLVKFKGKVFANEQMKNFPNLVNSATGVNGGAKLSHFTALFI